MPDQDKDAFETGEPNEFMPGEGDFEDEFESDDEQALEEDFEEAPEETPEERRDRRARRAEAESGGRRFRFGRGRDEEDEPTRGSLRTTHERVHIDDRLSALFVLVCTIGLVGILIGGFMGQYVPKGAGRTAPPLDLQTFVPTPEPSVTASPTLAPTASPSDSPSASPSAS